MKKEYDIIIIGSGPAGLTAGIYAGRYLMKTLIIGKHPGGTASEAWKVCNYPGFETIPGGELMGKVMEQVKKLGVEIVMDEIHDIHRGKDGFKVSSDKAEYRGKKIILALGTEKSTLGAKNEKKFLGKGISYCATCDAAFFKDKVAAVVGGSNAALTAALLLSEFAKKVYIIYRKDRFFRPEKAWIKMVEDNRKIQTIFNSKVVEVTGDQFLGKVKLDSGKELETDGLFIEIGSLPNTELIEKLDLDREGRFIKTDKGQRTSMHGVFAAGDVTKNPLKQIVVAAGEGAIAADSAYRELQEEQAKKK